MILVLFLALVAFAVAQVPTGTISCYQCASLELKSRWYLTMLPQTLPDDAFIPGCNMSSLSVSKDYFSVKIGYFQPSHTITCNNGGCLTYLIEDPDRAGFSKTLFELNQQ